jgi:hypothetical protein
MAKLIIEFDFPADKQLYLDHINGPKYKAVIESWLEKSRLRIEQTSMSMDAYHEHAAFRDLFIHMLKEADICDIL